MALISLENVTKTYSGQEEPAVADFNLDLKEGEIITFLGPSGCGKTTTLRIIAGFIKPDNGKVYFGDELMAGNGVNVKPEKRNIGMVFQDYALFPHLNVAENIIFGLEKKLSKSEQKEKVNNLLDLVGLQGYQDKYPNQLSGGQQQRVALSRALSRDPIAVLLDEPFSNLDEKLRDRMRKEVKDILRASNTAAIIVSHAREDGFSLSDRMVVMNQGKIEQIGSPEDIFKYPNSKFVAEFASNSNLIEVERINGESVDTSLGNISCYNLKQSAPDENCNCTMAVRPDAFKPDSEGEIKGKVEDYIYYGNYIEADIIVPAKCGNLKLTARFNDISVERGQEINMKCDGNKCWLINKSS